MTELKGYLRELTHAVGEPVTYVLKLDTDESDLENWWGRQLTLSTTGQKRCVKCGRTVKKLYQGGACYVCSTTFAEYDLCIVKPHECHFHQGTCRDETFAQLHCRIPHYVYLAFSSDIKVGITRKGRQLVRWVDQGALRAVIIAEVPDRKTAGEMEVDIARNLPDKTNWRKMLQTWETDVDLLATREAVVSNLSPGFHQYLLHTDMEVEHFVYPRLERFDVNIASVSLDKTSVMTGVLWGAKGQYLLLDTGVLNVRKHAGFEIQISVE